jgi:hypothetical protein
MKILCKYSSIEYEVSHFPFSLESREVSHPVFAIPQSKLITVIARKYPTSLTPIDSYLGFLALMHSTGKIDWRVPAYYIPQMDSIIAQNMELLLRTIGTINAITHPAFTYPGFVMTPDTRSLSTVHHWIQILIDCIQQFQDGNKRAQLRDRIVRREQAMERLIKDPSKNPANYANQLAEWAALAGAFPTGTVPVDGVQIPLSEYWKAMIRKAARAEAVFSLNDVDLAELVEHCEQEIPHGTIYAHTLMAVLRAAADKKKNLLGLGDLDIKTGTFRILDDSDTVERANLLAMIDSAPTEKPVESNYPSKIAFLRAHHKWRVAQTHKMQTEENGSSATDMLSKLGD